MRQLAAWAVAAAVALSCRGPDATRTDEQRLETVASGPPVKTPPRPVARTPDECRACRGEWGRHGLAEVDSCNCRTVDAGKRCRDAAECQGQCVAAEVPERDIVAPGPPPRGFFVGRCSDFVTVFGCFRRIERGATARGPVPLTEPPQMLCVD